MTRFKNVVYVGEFSSASRSGFVPDWEKLQLLNLIMDTPIGNHGGHIEDIP